MFLLGISLGFLTLIFQTQHGQIIKLVGIADKAVYCLAHIRQNLFGGFALEFIQRGQHPFRAEHLHVLICCLRHTVCIKKQFVTGPEHKIVAFVCGTIYTADDETMFIFEQFERPVRAFDDRVFVTCVGGCQSAC